MVVPLPQLVLDIWSLSVQTMYSAGCEHYCGCDIKIWVFSAQSADTCIVRSQRRLKLPESTLTLTEPARVEKYWFYSEACLQRRMPLVLDTSLWLSGENDIISPWSLSVGSQMLITTFSDNKRCVRIKDHLTSVLAWQFIIYSLLIFGFQFCSFLFYFVGFIVLSCFVFYFLSFSDLFPIHLWFVLVHLVSFCSLTCSQFICFSPCVTFSLF